MKKLLIEKEWIDLTSRNAEAVSNALGMLAAIYKINNQDLKGFAEMVAAAIYSFKIAREK